MENKFVHPDELESKMRSKLDLYNVYKFHFNYHLPSYRRCPVSFLKQLMNGKKSAFAVNELLMQNIPSFTELSISKLWNHFKDNQTIMKYMPDYESNQVPEKEFFFGVLSTVYPKETRDMVEAAYKARNTHYKKEKDEMVELTPEVKKAIDSILSYKTTSGKALSLLKVKVSGKRKMNERFIFPVDLSEFADPPIRIFRRIVPGADNQMVSLRRNRDQHMIDEEEEKKEDD